MCTTLVKTKYSRYEYFLLMTKKNIEKSDNVQPETSRALEAFLGLLDDYSDRSIGWGGFFIASMFGMYSLVSMVSKPVPGVVWAIVYFLLWIFGGYAMANFVWYFELANNITAEIRLLSPDFDRRLIKMLKRSDKGFWSLLCWFARWRARHPRLTIIILFVFYVCITWLPFLLILWIKSIPFY